MRRMPVLVCLALAACLAPSREGFAAVPKEEPPGAYQIGTAGGSFEGAALRTLTSIGLLTGGPSGAESVRHAEGFLLGFARPRLAASAEELDFGQVDTLEARSVQIWNLGGVALTLEDFTIGAGGPFAITDDRSRTVLPGDTTNVEVVFSPPADGLFVDELRIVTNDPARRSWTVRLSGSACAPRVASVAPSLDFGEVRLVERATQGLRIRNAGCDTLRVGPLTHASGAFLVSPIFFVVEPDSELVVDVSFMPDQVRAYADTLMIPTNDPGQPRRLEVLLTGSGTAILGIDAPDTVAAREAARVAVRIIGAITPDSGTLFYRLGGEGPESYLPVPMAISNNVAEAEIPGSASGIAGLEFYAELSYSGGSFPVADPERPRRIAVDLTGEDASAPALAGATYHIISFPVSTAGASPLEILVDDLGAHAISSWRLGHYDSSLPDGVREFPNPLGAPLEPGYGFWLITRDPHGIDADGTSVFPTLDLADQGEYFPIRLDAAPGGEVAGTQIGNPYGYPVRWDDCRIPYNGELLSPGAAADSNLIDSGLYEYVGSLQVYQLADRLEPWKGYFVGSRAPTDLELLIPAVRAEAGSMRAQGSGAPAAGEWELVLSSPGETRGAVAIGNLRDAEDGWDRFDHFLPPGPRGDRPGLALHGGDREATSTPLSSDYRAVSGEVQRWLLTASFPQQTEREIVVSSSRPPPEAYAILLVDAESRDIQELKTDEPGRLLPVPGRGARDYTVVVGPRDVLEAQGIEPTAMEPTFRLDPTAPNPFRDRVSIRYSIPRAGAVRLSVFDVRGRLVKRLLSGIQGAGPHALEWDGSGRHAERVPSGLYFIRLQHGSKVATVRLIRQF